MGVLSFLRYLGIVNKLKDYQIGSKDLYVLALIETEKLRVSFFKKEKLKAQSIGILKKYNVKFLDIRLVLKEINERREEILSANIEKYQDFGLSDIDSKQRLKYTFHIGVVIVLIICTLFCIVNSGPSACDCANLYGQSPFKKNYRPNEINDGYTLQRDADEFIEKAKDCALKFGDLTDVERKILKGVYQVGMIPNFATAIENAKNECVNHKEFSPNQLALGCECWNQSVEKLGMAYDNMSSSQKEFREKCFEIFEDEASMKMACEQVAGSEDENTFNTNSTRAENMVDMKKGASIKLRCFPMRFTGSIGSKAIKLIFNDGDNNFSVVNGFNQVENNIRPISGYFVSERDEAINWKTINTPGTKFKIICQEPGSHKNDGSFKFNGIVESNGKIKLTGTWEMYSNGLKQQVIVIEN